MKTGDVVQFRCYWGQEPTVHNTSIITRIAKDKSWADVDTNGSRKRVRNPLKNLKIVDEPINVYVA